MKRVVRASTVSGMSEDDAKTRALLTAVLTARAADADDDEAETDMEADEEAEVEASVAGGGEGEAEAGATRAEPARRGEEGG